MNNDLFERLLILRSPRIGPVAYNNLLNRFGSPGAIESVNIIN